MNLEVYETFTETHQWGILWVEMFLLGSALLIMILQHLLGVEMRKLIPGFATMLLGIITMIFIGVMLYEVPSGVWFSGLIAGDMITNGFRLFLLLTSFFVCLISMVFFESRSIPNVQFYAILLIVTACMCLLVQSNHIVMLFVSVELVTIGVYCLINNNSNRFFGFEAGIKYFIFWGISSTILLLGIVLLYANIGYQSDDLDIINGFSFSHINALTREYSEMFWIKAGALLLVAGLFLKIGLAPFHIWVPDVCQIAPTPVTALIELSLKGVGFALLLLLFRPGGALAALGEEFIPIFSVLAGLSILWGSLSGLGERNVKRLIGFSGIAHSGYLLLGMIVYINEPDNGFIISVIFFYLFSYLFASLAVFGVMVHWGGANDADQQQEHYVNLAKDNPFFALIMLTGLSSLSGIPPMAGFIANFLLFMVTFEAELWGLLTVAILGFAISSYYYFGWIREVFFKPSHAYNSPKDKKWIPASSLFKSFWVGIVLLLFLLGIYQGDWFRILVNSQKSMDSYESIREPTVLISD